MVKEDKIEFANDDVEESGIKMKAKRFVRNWSDYLPLALALLSLVLILITIISMSVQISHLKQQIEQGSRGGNPVASGQTQNLDQGTTYTRWGKRTCPPGAERIYEGFGAGSSSSTERLTGGGANLLCMHKEPEWNKFDMKNDSMAFSWLYAAEYLTYDLGIYNVDVDGHNVVCSSCRAPRSSQVMIPGRRTCPSGWYREYEGYLMSSYITQSRLTFICVDQEPDVIEGTKNITGGAMLFFTSGFCEGNGNLQHCPPYQHAKEITCVVCTK